MEIVGSNEYPNPHNEINITGKKIAFISDLHLDTWFNPAIPLSRKKRMLEAFCNKLFFGGDILIIAGDISAYIHQVIDFLFFLKREDFFKYIIYVIGNHELYLLSRKMKEKYRNSCNKMEILKEKLREIPELFLLDGEVIEIEGIKFGGTMGWYDGKYLLERGYSLQEIENLYYELMNDSRYIIFPDCNKWKFLCKFESEWKKLKAIYRTADVIVTHIPPLIDDRVFNSNEDPIYRGFYSFDGEELLKETSASFWIYGHTHKSANFTYGGVQLISDPIGYGID
jgi:Icc-related predicted phosphoesterase